MNPTLREPGSWSRTRWTLTILAVFACHLGFLFGLSAPKAKPPSADDRGLQIVALIDPKSNERWLDAMSGNDPAVFALGHRSGFSGRAWSSGNKIPAAPLSWSSQPSFMGPAIASLGSSFVSAAGSPSGSDTFSSERRVSAIETEMVSSAPVRRASRLLVSADLQRLGLVLAPDLPLLRSAESVRDSFVEIDVDGSGRVFSCRVSNEQRQSPVDEMPPKPLSESQKNADLLALTLARQVRFQPRLRGQDALPSPELNLQWGKLRFQWGYEVEPSEEGAEKK